MSRSLLAADPAFHAFLLEIAQGTRGCEELSRELAVDLFAALDSEAQAAKAEEEPAGCYVLAYGECGIREVLPGVFDAVLAKA